MGNEASSNVAPAIVPTRVPSTAAAYDEFPDTSPQRVRNAIKPPSREESPPVVKSKNEKAEHPVVVIDLCNNWSGDTFVDLTESCNRLPHWTGESFIDLSEGFGQVLQNERSGHISMLDLTECTNEPVAVDPNICERRDPVLYNAEVEREQHDTDDTWIMDNDEIVNAEACTESKKEEEEQHVPYPIKEEAMEDTCPPPPPPLPRPDSPFVDEDAIPDEILQRIVDAKEKSTATPTSTADDDTCVVRNDGGQHILKNANAETRLESREGGRIPYSIKEEAIEDICPPPRPDSPFTDEDAIPDEILQRIANTKEKSTANPVDEQMIPIEAAEKVAEEKAAKEKARQNLRKSLESQTATHTKHKQRQKARENIAKLKKAYAEVIKLSLADDMEFDLVDQILKRKDAIYNKIMQLAIENSLTDLVAELVEKEKGFVRAAPAQRDHQAVTNHQAEQWAEMLKIREKDAAVAAALKD